MTMDVIYSNFEILEYYHLLALAMCSRLKDLIHTQAPSVSIPVRNLQAKSRWHSFEFHFSIFSLFDSYFSMHSHIFYIQFSFTKSALNVIHPAKSQLPSRCSTLHTGIPYSRYQTNYMYSFYKTELSQKVPNNFACHLFFHTCSPTTHYFISHSISPRHTCFTSHMFYLKHTHLLYSYGNKRSFVNSEQNFLFFTLLLNRY